VRVRIDEARGDHEIRSVHIGGGDRRREIADGRDPPATDTDVGFVAGGSRAVDERAAANDQIEGQLSLASAPEGALCLQLIIWHARL
jgi:hypothetical protein